MEMDETIAACDKISVKKSFSENLKIERVEVSNVRVDAAVSADSQFAAVQLLRFMDYLYQPVSEVRMFEGPAAQAVCSLFK